MDFALLCLENPVPLLCLASEEELRLQNLAPLPSHLLPEHFLQTFTEAHAHFIMVVSSHIGLHQNAYLKTTACSSL